MASQLQSYNTRTKNNVYITVNNYQTTPTSSTTKQSPTFNTNATINPSSLKLIENIDEIYLNSNNITNEKNIIQITEFDYNNYSGFNIQTELPNGIIIKLPNIPPTDIRIYISFTIINSSNQFVTITSDNNLIYNSLFIDPNGSNTYSLFPNKMSIATLFKQNNKWIWGLIIS
jgi:hypothetical protein